MARKVVRKKAKSKQSNSTVFKKEITSIVSIALGIYFIICIWFGSGGAIGDTLTSVLKGLFGCVTYFLPIFIIAIAFFLFVTKQVHVYVKCSVLSCIPILLSMLTHWIYMLNKPLQFDFFAAYSEGVAGHGGGFFGSLLTEPLIWLTAPYGALIVIIALLLISLVLLFEISIMDFFRKVGCGVKEFMHNTGNDIEEIEETELRQAPNINIEPLHRHKKKAPELMEYVEAEPVSEEEDSSDTELEEFNWAADNLVINDVVNNMNSEISDEPSDEADFDDDVPFDTEPDKKSEVSMDTEEITPLEIDEPPIYKEYIFPTTDLLYEGPKVHTGGKLDELKANAQRLVEIFESFGIETKVTNITRGSSITRYEVVPAAGIKVNKITALDQDIALRLPASNVRIEVLPGYVGVEVSNDSVSTVYLRGLLETAEFKTHESNLAVAVGRDINGATVVMDIAKTPHLLIAGATGSGKSVCINTIIASILYKSTPDEVKLVMVDPKVVELGVYNGVPHLLVPIVTDPRKAAGALSWAVTEMEDRYKKFADVGARDLKGYNTKLLASDPNARKLPQIVIIIDELADLMMVAPGEVQDYICRLAQKARAAGMHLVLATQRPSVDVITGLIKANIPSRISFAVSSAVDSRTILDHGGAEKLMGKGDMLMMLAGMSKLRRVQGAFISDTDVEHIVNFVKEQTDAEYNTEVLKKIETGAAGGGNASPSDGVDSDELFEAAAEVAFELGQVSASMLQRRLKVGYARAGRLIDLLDKNKVISTYDGSNKPRTLQMTREDFNIMMGTNSDE